MGLFYTTFTAYGPDYAQVADALQSLERTAFVSPTVNGYTVVYDRLTEEQDFSEIEAFGEHLSGKCNAAVLAAVLHDDDVLFLWLFRAGKCCDFYDSCPSYFDPQADETGPPEGGDATALCEAFGQSGKEARLETFLRANLLDDELPEIRGELERHQALLQELGMPVYAAAVTYSSVAGKYHPEEFQKIEFTAVGRD